MRFNSVDNWLHWQQSLHPSEIELGLDRVYAVYRQLQLDFTGKQVLTVAGTNGKGSCVAMLSAILRAAGYRVGTYTSPHLLHYSERICVNGQAISDSDLCEAFERVDQARGATSLTYFEFGTLAALYHFAQQDCDVLVLEVGLGGRLDAVNILNPSIALISTISLDHTDWLGSDRNAIAREKAGILRPDGRLVCGELDPPEALLHIIDHLGVKAWFAGRDFHYRLTVNGAEEPWSWHLHNQHIEQLPRPALAGDFQIRNAACVITALKQLEDVLPVSDVAIREGLGSVRLPGRIQLLNAVPPVYVDVAHNPEAVQALASDLRRQSVQGKTHAVFSLLHNKDLPGILNAIYPQIDVWHIAPLREGVGMDVQKIANFLNTQCNSVEVRDYADIPTAWRMARSALSEADRLVGFGSFYTVAEILSSV